MIWQGLRFGMILQLAVGPLCVLTFRAAAGDGVLAGLQVALAVTLADAAFVTLSGLGAAAVLRRPGVSAAVRWIGCLVLCLFGADIILNALHIGVLPQIRLFGASGGWFWQGFFVDGVQPADDHLLGRGVYRPGCRAWLYETAADAVCRRVCAVDPPVAYGGRGSG